MEDGPRPLGRTSNVELHEQLRRFTYQVCRQSRAPSVLGDEHRYGPRTVLDARRNRASSGSAWCDEPGGTTP